MLEVRSHPSGLTAREQVPFAYPTYGSAIRSMIWAEHRSILFWREAAMDARDVSPHRPPNSSRPHIVIVGGGFGGLYAARGGNMRPFLNRDAVLRLLSPGGIHRRSERDGARKARGYGRTWYLRRGDQAGPVRGKKVRIGV